LEQLEHNYVNKFAKPGNVEKGIQEIIYISLAHEKSSKSYSNEELLAELEAGNFIPEEKCISLEHKKSSKSYSNEEPLAELEAVR
jgi:hypothetical protein